MAEYIPSDEREEPTTKNALLSKTLIQILWRNQKLSTQAKIRSDQISRSVVSDSLQPYELQHARPPCPSPTPGVHRDSRPLSR